MKLLLSVCLLCLFTGCSIMKSYTCSSVIVELSEDMKLEEHEGTKIDINDNRSKYTWYSARIKGIIIENNAGFFDRCEYFPQGKWVNANVKFPEKLILKKGQRIELFANHYYELNGQAIIDERYKLK